MHLQVNEIVKIESLKRSTKGPGVIAAKNGRFIFDLVITPQKVPEGTCVTTTVAPMRISPASSYTKPVDVTVVSYDVRFEEKPGPMNKIKVNLNSFLIPDSFIVQKYRRRIWKLNI